MSNQGQTGEKKHISCITIDILDTFCHRDQYVRVNTENILPGKADVNFNKKNPANVLVYGDYDYGSIMHYGTCYFTKNGWETITVLVS